MSNSREQKITTVEDADGVRWEVRTTPFGAYKSAKLLPNVLRLTSPVGSLVDMVGGGQGEDFTKNKIEGKALTEAILSLAEVLENDAGPDFILKLLSDTMLKKEDEKKLKKAGDKAVFEIAFQGNLLFLLKVVAHVIQCNYVNFLNGLNFDALLEKYKSLIESDTDSKDSTPDQD